MSDAAGHSADDASAHEVVVHHGSMYGDTTMPLRLCALDVSLTLRPCLGHADACLGRAGPFGSDEPFARLNKAAAAYPPDQIDHVTAATAAEAMV